MEGRSAATKKDVDDVAIGILQHRIVKNFKAQAITSPIRTLFTTYYQT